MHQGRSACGDIQHNQIGGSDAPKKIKGNGCLPIIATAIIVFALMFLVVWHSPAHSMGMCGDHEDFVKALNDKYSETRKHVAVAGRNSIIEVFNSKTGTWTILITTANGRTCIIGSGDGWEDLELEILGDDT